MIDPAANPPALPAPTPTQHTTVITGDQPVAQVIFAAPDDGRWFRLLNSLIDSGAWGRLSGQARSVLVVLARHASQDGTSLPSLATLIVQSGLSRSGVHNGLKELAAGERPLIRKVSAGRAWELFPGRPFARRGRGGREVPSLTQLPPDRPLSSTVVDRPPRDPCTPVHTASTPVDKPSTPVDVLLRRQTSDVDVDTFADDDGDVALIGRLEAIGIRRQDVADLVRQHGARAVETALANTEYQRDARQIRTTPRQYFFTALRSRFPLFAEVEKKQRQLELARALCRAVRPHMTPTQEELIGAAFKTWRGAAKFAGITSIEHLRRIEADGQASELAAWLVERAAQAAEVRT